MTDHYFEYRQLLLSDVPFTVVVDKRPDDLLHISITIKPASLIVGTTKTEYKDI